MKTEYQKHLHQKEQEKYAGRMLTVSLVTIILIGFIAMILGSINGYN